MDCNSNTQPILLIIAKMFNYELFESNLRKNNNILNIMCDAKDIVTVSFVDGFKLVIDTCGDDMHKFYTYITHDDETKYYFGKMPHDTFDELYWEINRMSDVSRRVKPCQKPYFKSDSLFM